MKSPFYFICEPIGGQRYSNTKNIGGIEFIVNTSEEDHKYSNREAKVLSTPLWYKGEISEGDTLLVHHNTFKYYNDMKGNKRSGKSFFRDNVFLIEPDQFFLYKKQGDWKAYDKYCFVKPIPKKESYLYKNIINEPLMGEMIYPNDYLIKNGVSKGDIVSFTPESEYEFEVDGQVLYRIFDHQITAIV